MTPFSLRSASFASSSAVDTFAAACPAASARTIIWTSVAVTFGRVMMYTSAPSHGMMIRATIQTPFMTPLRSSRLNRSMKQRNQIMIAITQKKMIAMVQKKSSSVPLNIVHLKSRSGTGRLRSRRPIVRHVRRRRETLRASS